MLRAKELWQAAEEKKAHRLKAMRPVLSGIFTAIKHHAATSTDNPYYATEVPSFVFGYPLYDHEEAIVYVKETLEEQGFCVWRVNTPSVLFISWMKPIKDIKDVPKPPRSGPDYRPFVYDESAFAFLTRQ